MRQYVKYRTGVKIIPIYLNRLSFLKNINIFWKLKYLRLIKMTTLYGKVMWRAD